MKPTGSTAISLVPSEEEKKQVRVNFTDSGNVVLLIGNEKVIMTRKEIDQYIARLTMVKDAAKKAEDATRVLNSLHSEYNDKGK